MQLGSLGERNLIWCILALTGEIWWQQFYFFPENEHSKLANVMHFKRMFMSCLEDWGGTWPPECSLVYATGRMDGEAYCVALATIRSVRTTNEQRSVCIR